MLFERGYKNDTRRCYNAVHYTTCIKTPILFISILPRTKWTYLWCAVLCAENHWYLVLLGPTHQLLVPLCFNLAHSLYKVRAWAPLSRDRDHIFQLIKREVYWFISPLICRFFVFAANNSSDPHHSWNRENAPCRGQDRVGGGRVGYKIL